MTKPPLALIRKWYKKAATCPHKPKCKPLRSCDKAVPMDDHKSMYELGGSGGSDPENRTVSFVQLNSTFHEDPHEDSMADRLVHESTDTFGSALLADHPTAVAWRLFSQAVQELPRRYPNRRALVLLSEYGSVTKAARKVKVTVDSLQGILSRFCVERGVLRPAMLTRKH